MINLAPIILTVLSLLLVSKLTNAQYETWSDPVSLTDSITDNKNATIKLLRFIDENYYAFWGKSTNSNSTSIYYKNFYNSDEPQIFLSDAGIHYTNPQLIDTWFSKYSNDSLFFIFYESDETETNKIYYQIYNPDGFTEPEALTESSEEQTNLICNNDGEIVWMEQNRIMHIHLNKYTFAFTEPFVIDSGNCNYPSIKQTDYGWWGYGIPIVSWVKEVNDISNIMVRWYDNTNGWLPAESIFTGLQCTNLSFCTGFATPEILTWDYFNDTSWHIANYDLTDSQLFISEFDLQYPPYSSFYSGDLPVKSNWMGIGFSSFVYQNNYLTDIFTTPFYGGVYSPLDAYQNVSKSNNQVRNPRVYSGKNIGNDYYFINIWEEYVNAHWQLKYSITHEYLSGVKEPENIEINSIEVNPNPTNDKTKISFSLDHSSQITISICNSSGVIIETIKKTNLNAGDHSYIWNRNGYNPGLYFVNLQSDLGSVSKKLILIE
jgi:hypothetical protein